MWVMWLFRWRWPLLGGMLIGLLWGILWFFDFSFSTSTPAPAPAPLPAKVQENPISILRTNPARLGY